MCHPPIEMPATHFAAATTKPSARAPPTLRGILGKKRSRLETWGPGCESDDDTRSSASTPPPEVPVAATAHQWMPLKRNCSPRVRIASAVGVRYINDLAALAHSAEPDYTDSGRTEGVEEAKFVDGPSPEAVVVDRLLLAVASMGDTAAVCPILKVLVQTGASDLLNRVHERLLAMDRRIAHRGKVFLLPSSASLGHDSAPLICFLHESVGRAKGLVQKFQDRTAQVFDEVDAGLLPSQRSAAAAMLLLSQMAVR